jgi:hypothetical protein
MYPFFVAAGDPVGDFFNTWKAHATSWMPALIIFTAVVGYILYTIGHHRGWAHMREALAGAVFVMLVISLVPTLFP